MMVIQESEPFRTVGSPVDAIATRCSVRQDGMYSMRLRTPLISKDAEYVFDPCSATDMVVDMVGGRIQYTPK